MRYAPAYLTHWMERKKSTEFLVVESMYIRKQPDICWFVAKLLILLKYRVRIMLKVILFKPFARRHCWRAVYGWRVAGCAVAFLPRVSTPYLFIMHCYSFTIIPIGLYSFSLFFAGSEYAPRRQYTFQFWLHTIVSTYCSFPFHSFLNHSQFFLFL